MTTNKSFKEFTSLDNEFKQVTQVALGSALHGVCRKIPSLSLVGLTCPKRSNWVLGISILLIFLLGIISAQASELRPKYPKSPISMSLASSINQLQSAPKLVISLLSNG